MVLSPSGPGADPRIGQAIIVAAPWSEAAKDVYPGTDVRLIISYANVVDLPLEGQRYSPVEARQLLAAAGFSNGIILLVTGADDEFVPWLTKYLGQVGITVTTTSTPSIGATLSVQQLR